MVPSIEQAEHRRRNQKTVHKRGFSDKVTLANLGTHRDYPGAFGGNMQMLCLELNQGWRVLSLRGGTSSTASSGQGRQREIMQGEYAGIYKAFLGVGSE